MFTFLSDRCPHRRRRLGPVFLALAALGICAPVSAPAGTNPDAKLVLHVVPTSTAGKANCFSHKVETHENVVVKGDLYPQHYLAYVLITDFDLEVGLAGMQFGISYNEEPKQGVDILTWQDCGLYQFHMEDWPAANTGNLLTWNQREDCQQEQPLVAGYFYLTAYSPDRFQIIPRPLDGIAQVAACGLKQLNAKEKVDTIKLANLGWAGFGDGEEGYNPWDPEQSIQNLENKFQPIKPGNKKD